MLGILNHRFGPKIKIHEVCQTAVIYKPHEFKCFSNFLFSKLFTKETQETIIRSLAMAEEARLLIIHCGRKFHTFLLRDRISSVGV